jgi:hypothetical protein
MRTLDAANAAAPSLCQWHTLAKEVLPFPCSREQQSGRATCAQHSAELDLRSFEAAHSPKCAWVIYWAAGSRLMRRCKPSEIAELLLRRHPEGLLEQSKDRIAMELRVHGRLVAIVRRLEWLK